MSEIIRVYEGDVGYDDWDDDIYVGDPLDMEVGIGRAGRRFGRAMGGIFGGPAALGRIIRQRRKRKQRARQAGRMAARQAAAQAPPLRPRTDGRRLLAGSQEQRPLGLGSVTLAASASGNLQAVVQKAFQAQRLVLQSDDLDSIVVQAIRMGVDCTEAGVLEYPATLFSANAENTAYQFTPVDPGLTVIVNLRNTDAANAHTVTGAFIGVSTR